MIFQAQDALEAMLKYRHMSPTFSGFDLIYIVYLPSQLQI